MNFGQAIEALKEGKKPEINKAAIPIESDSWHFHIENVPAFNSYHAEKLLDAFQVIIKMRQQPGVVVDGCTDQWIIRVITIIGAATKVCIEHWRGSGYKKSFISPCYATKEDAENAVKVVGRDRIVACFNTLHGRW